MKFFMSFRDSSLAGFLRNLSMVEAESFEDADVIAFPGGRDIDPRVYDRPNEGSVWTNYGEDLIEVELFKKAIESGKIIIGICRGAQLANVLLGGEMIQDLGRYVTGRNPSVDKDGHTFYTYKDHHQAIIPTEECTVLLTNLEFGTLDMGYYEKEKVFMIQGHPEWGDRETEELFEDHFTDFLEVVK